MIGATTMMAGTFWPHDESGKVRAQESESSEAESRFEDHIETDRDSFTPSTPTVGQGRFVLESAYSFIDRGHRPSAHSYPEILGRYGLNEWIELRVGWNMEVGGGNPVSSIGGPDEDLGVGGLPRESRTLYGFKIVATRQQDWLPESSFVVQGFTPTSGEEDATEMSATYVWGWELPHEWKLDSAVRFATDREGDDHFVTWSPSTVLRVPFGERWNGHIEYFGNIPSGLADGKSQHYFSTGPHVLLTPNLELGVRVGWGLNDASARFFTNAGFGWRF
ncbi:MAG: transporter [Pirellulales bacterium]